MMLFHEAETLKCNLAPDRAVGKACPALY